MLFVTSPAALGGSNRSLVTLLSVLEGKVDRVLASPSRGTFVEHVRAEGLADEYVNLPRRFNTPLDRFLRIFGGLRIALWAARNRGRLVAIHANALTGLVLATPAALIARKRTVVWVHDPVGSWWGKRLGPIVRRLVPDLRCAAVSPTAEAVAVANGLCRPGDAAIIPNPIDPEEVLSTRAREGAHPIHVGFVGGATERKGFDLLPEVIRATSEQPLVWKLYVHKIPLQENESIWRKLRRFPPEQVDPVGKTADIASIYAQLDIVFCPSRIESFCRVAAEAMMNGLPVVASDIPPLRRLLGGNGEAGILFRPGDTEEAASAIIRLTSDSTLRRILGEEGRRRAAEFPPHSVARQLVDLYGVPWVLASDEG